MKKDIITSVFLFTKWMAKCRSVYSIDCETTSLNYLDLELIGFSICDGKQACYVDLLDPYIDKQEILDVLDFYIGENKLIIFHNAPFDLMVLHKYGIEL